MLTTANCGYCAKCYVCTSVYSVRHLQRYVWKSDKASTQLWEYSFESI